jgi:hypothetical protein
MFIRVKPEKRYSRITMDELPPIHCPPMDVPYPALRHQLEGLFSVLLEFGDGRFGGLLLRG